MLEFTDASETATSSACVIIVNGIGHKYKLPALNISYNSEALAIWKAIELINENQTSLSTFLRIFLAHY